ncbi:MAG: isochorismatase family protein [Bacteroidaceae bacterium]|nr:isochorismatase family protein [Bacteroidaceae bacterium]
MKKLLLIVDAQYDFINGSLPVPGAEKAMDELSRWMDEQKCGTYENVVLTADFHTWEHVSFGRWPVHCVAHTQGAAIWQTVLEAAYKLCPQTKVLTKGTLKGREEYSILKNAVSRRKLLPLLDEAEQIDVCGIAGDVCVLDTLKDLAQSGYKKKLNVLLPFCPSLDGGKALNDFVQSTKLSTMNYEL